MPQVNDMDGQELAREVKAIYADVPVVLLAHSVAFAGSGSKPIDCGKDIDHFFIWSSDPALFLAIIKNVEDHLNVAVDTTKAMVRVLILVEDSPSMPPTFCLLSIGWWCSRRRRYLMRA